MSQPPADLFSPEALAQLMAERGYRPIRELKRLQGLSDIEFLDEKFLCQDQADRINEVPVDQAHIVTGFGPTNAPTGGTLSVIFKAKSLRRETGMETTLIISNLGAWCSRRTPPQTLGYYTACFMEFIQALGLETAGRNLRTHESLDVLRIAGLLTRFLSEQDFEHNQEATATLYGNLGLLGNRFGIWTDTAYTVADILEPLICRGKRRVLVLAGIEEHYFADLARLVIPKMNADYPGMFLPKDSHVGGLYARLIGGLHPYPKMSKSIPESAINLNDSEAVLRAKILDAHSVNDPVLLQMMTLVSDWSVPELQQAREAFRDRTEQPQPWAQARQKYFEFFLGLKRSWDQLVIRPQERITSFFPSTSP
ncbi:hypothetical protein [Hyalangium sp.]|uniref:hypothetical protein n=1 Tax=Hyalangium sp. TaxID=2028555 RepID=UPI002D5F6140|nr:hypothetical protein [Hyalangium sp.]HYI01804.1 hypothetical protein [Hyalangium sp.]